MAEFLTDAELDRITVELHLFAGSIITRLITQAKEANRLRACDEAGTEAMNDNWARQAEELAELENESYESIRARSPLGMDGLSWRTRAVLAEKEISRLQSELAEFHAKLDTPWKYTCGCPAQRDLGLKSFCDTHCKILEPAFFKDNGPVATTPAS